MTCSASKSASSVVSRAEPELGAEHGIAHCKEPEQLRTVREPPLAAVGKVDKKAVEKKFSPARAGVIREFSPGQG
jgi:non-ribosomal peptide synthetase component E (peptide arylation enzyme)